MPERNSKTGVTVAEPMSYTHIRGRQPPSMKKGGEVKKTGVYLLHKGEHVIPKKYTKKRDAKKHKCPH